MPLPAGGRLGPYEILAAIGAGGMSACGHARASHLRASRYGCQGRPLTHRSLRGLTASDSGSASFSEQTRRGVPAFAKATARSRRSSMDEPTSGGGGPQRQWKSACGHAAATSAREFCSRAKVGGEASAKERAGGGTRASENVIPPMPTTGARLGPYEILGALGAGGMSACGHASARHRWPSASISEGTRRGWGPGASEKTLIPSPCR